MFFVSQVAKCIGEKNIQYFRNELVRTNNTQNKPCIDNFDYYSSYLKSIFFNFYTIININVLTLSNLNLPWSSSSTTSRYCCRNSRLAVDEDDLKCVANKKKISFLLKQS